MVSLSILRSLRTVGDIVENVIVRKQSVALENHGRIALVRCEGVDRLSSQVDYLHPGSQSPAIMQRVVSLAASGRSEQSYEACPLNIGSEVSLTA